MWLRIIHLLALRRTVVLVSDASKISRHHCASTSLDIESSRAAWAWFVFLASCLKLKILGFLSLTSIFDAVLEYVGRCLLVLYCVSLTLAFGHVCLAVTLFDSFVHVVLCNVTATSIFITVTECFRVSVIQCLWTCKCICGSASTCIYACMIFRRL